MAFEYLEQYITFDSVAEMDEHVDLHLNKHRNELTESDRAIVRKIARHALATPGASHLKAIKIANDLEISTKTVYRAVKKLVELGIIRKVHTVRQKMSGRGANIYVILPCEIEEVATQEAHEPTTYMNEWQQMLYDFMQSLSLPKAMDNELHKVVLASNVKTAQEFVRAKNVLFNIAKDIADGVLTVKSTLRAVFMGAYKASVARKKDKTSTTVEEKPHIGRPVPFYNWLEERDSKCPEFFVPNRNNSTVKVGDTVFSPY